MADPVLLSITLEFQRREDELCLGAISGVAFWLRRDRKSPTTVRCCRELADLTWTGRRGQQVKEQVETSDDPPKQSAQNQKKEVARSEYRRLQ